MTTEPDWQQVPFQAIELALKCAGTTKSVRQAIQNLDQDGFLGLWYNADNDHLFLNVGDWMPKDIEQQWEAALQPLAQRLEVADEAASPAGPQWVKIAERPWEARAFLEKRATSPTLSTLATMGGLKPGLWNAPGAGTNPLTALLASGLLGTGIGYGTGYLAEQILPEEWHRGRLRRTGAVAGGLLGAAPALAWMGANTAQGQPVLQGHPSQPSLDYSRRSLPETFEAFGRPSLQKAGDSLTGYDGMWPPIDVPQFHETVWEDSRVSGMLTPQTRAAITGLTTGASAMRAGARFVSPLDIARIAMGMGTGYASGAAVGKVLGLLTGMPEQTQERLKNTGLYAGILANMVPLAFGA